MRQNYHHARFVAASAQFIGTIAMMGAVYFLALGATGANQNHLSNTFRMEMTAHKPTKKHEANGTPAPTIPKP